MAQEKSSHERRHPRIEKLNLVQVSRFDEDGVGTDLTTGRTLDISEGGVRLELYCSVPLRSTVSLTLALDNQLVDVSGTVAHLEVVDHERCTVGIAFQDLSDTAQKLLEAYVKSLS